MFLVTECDFHVKALYPVHCVLLEGFKKCVESSKADITRYFMEAERDLLNYGKYAARLPMAVEKVSMKLSSKIFSH